jgi:hypothetical protein
MIDGRDPDLRLFERARRLFERAEFLGVHVKTRGDEPILELLLEAVHTREGELVLLRHAIIRELAKLPGPEATRARGDD